MKLTRNTTTDANPDLRGRKHYFTIENAPAIVLEAMDEMLVKAGWENDGCPCYDDGFGCGWWIDLSDIADFKAAYKEAKAGVRGYMARRAIDAHFDTRVTDIKAAHAEALDIEAARQLTARQARFVFHNTAAERAEIIEAAHEEALALNVVFRKAKARYDHFWGAYSYWKRRELVEKAHEAALIEDATFEENLLFLATPEMADVWNNHTDTLKARILAAAHTEALALDAEYGYPARFEYVNANGYEQTQLLAAAHEAAFIDANYVSADQMAHEFLTEQAHAEALPMTATEAIRHMANTLTRHMEQSELPGFDADAAYRDIKANFDEVAARCNDRAITVWLHNHLCFGYIGDICTFIEVNKPYRDQFNYILNTGWRPEESATLTLTTIFEMDWWGAAEITVTKRDGDKVYGTASVTDTEGLYQIAFEWLMDMGEEADRVGLPAVVSITGGKFILPNEVFLQRDNGTPLDVVEAIQEMDCVLGLSADIINEVYAEEEQGK